MRRHLLIIYAALCLAWLGFGLWQYRNYCQQLALIEESLYQQSHSIMTALVGGIGSHRRIGQYFQGQLQAMLDELAESADVIAVAIYAGDDQLILAAGQATGVPPADAIGPDAASPDAAGPDADTLPPHALRVTETFELTPLPAGPGGGGMRGGGGGGRGRGLGPRRWGDDPDNTGPFAAGGMFRAELWLDRSRADLLIVQSRWSHLWATIAAGVVAICLGLVWRATVSLADARGQARVYQTETRHLQELSQAAAGLAHETRNPLGLIRGWTQRLAQSRMSDEERQQFAQSVLEECDRVTARINQFLAFARPRQPQFTAVAVEALCRELAVILQPDLESARLSLTWEVTPATRHLRADSELLRQALFNLVQNAVQFSPPDQQVELWVRPQSDKTASIQVADRAPGVPAEVRPSLFTPYFTTRAQGTGLGLAIVRHIATLHGWTTSYHPRDGGGAVFELDGIHVTHAENSADRG